MKKTVILAAIGLLAGCDTGESSRLPTPNLAHIDVAAGEVMLLKTSSDTDNFGQPLASDLQVGQLTAVAADGSLRALHLTDSTGAARSFNTVTYDDADPQLGVFNFDGEIYAFRKADGVLVRLGHRAPYGGVTGLYTTLATSSPRIYVLSTDGFVHYDKAAIAAAAAGSSIAPTLLFAVTGYSPPPAGIVDEAAGVIYLPATGVVSFAGAPLLTASFSEPYIAGPDTVYTYLQATFAQCPGGATSTLSTMGVIAVTPAGTTTTPLLATRPSSDPTCDPMTDFAFANASRNRKLFGWKWPDVPRAGAASYAFEVVGGTIVEQPNLSQALAADFTSLAGSTFFDCTADRCLLSAAIPEALVGFGVDDAQDLYASDDSPPFVTRSLHAMPTSGDFFVRGESAVARVAVSPGGLTYTVVTVNGDYEFAAID